MPFLMPSIYDTASFYSLKSPIQILWRICIKGIEAWDSQINCWLGCFVFPSIITVGAWGGWKLQCMGVMDPAALCVVGSSMPRNIDGSTFPMQSIYLILVFLHIILWVHGGVWKLRCVGVVDPAALCVVGSGMPRNIDGSTLPMQCYNSDFSCLFITITSPPPGLGGGGGNFGVWGWWILLHFVWGDPACPGT